MQHDLASADSSERPKLTRSKAGCQTCREKRVKCGEEKPICEQCRVANRLCTYQASTKTTKAEKMKVLQPRDAPVAIRPKAAAGVASPRGSFNPPSPDHARRSMNTASASTSTPIPPTQPHLQGQASAHSSWATDSKDQQPVNSAGRLESSMPGATDSDVPHTKAFSERILPQIPGSPSSQTAAVQAGMPQPNPHTSIHALESSQIFRPDFTGGFGKSVIAGGRISVPPPLTLSQYCFASSSATSTPMGFLRNTYLARLTAGAYLLSDGNFASVVAPVLDEIDPNSQMVINDPMRLHNTFSNSCFQEAYVTSLRDSLHAPVHLIRAWCSALFLLVMSLELGMFSSGDRHLSEAISCFTNPDVRQLIKSGMPDHYVQLMLFLTESTYRYASTIALATGSKLAAFSKDDLLPISHPLDIVLRTTNSLKIQVIEIMRSLVFPAESNMNRERIGKEIDGILWEIYESERLQKEHSGGQTQDQMAGRPFGYKAFSSPEWAHASMALIFNKLLLSNIVTQFSRRDLINEYFAILGHLILVSQQEYTLDLMATTLSSAMLEDPEERRWVLDALRTGVGRGCTLLVPYETFERCLLYVWQVVDSYSTTGLDRDWELIRTLQHAYREILKVS